MFNQAQSDDNAAVIDSAWTPAALQPRVTCLIADAKGAMRAADRPGDRVLRAASCLLALRGGDLVRIVRHAGIDYVTDVLARREEGVQVIDAGGQPLRIMATRLELVAGESIGLRAPRLTLVAAFSFWVSRHLNLRPGRLWLKARQVQREVRGIDATHARHLHQRADEAMVMRGRVGSVRMDGVLRIDGAQVHVG
jgi:Protein of unknown function (DUF3540)